MQIITAFLENLVQINLGDGNNSMNKSKSKKGNNLPAVRQPPNQLHILVVVVHCAGCCPAQWASTKYWLSYPWPRQVVSLVNLLCTSMLRSTLYLIYITLQLDFGSLLCDTVCSGGHAGSIHHWVAVTPREFWFDSLFRIIFIYWIFIITKIEIQIICIM